MSRFRRTAFLRGEAVVAALAVVLLMLLPAAPERTITRGAVTAGDLAVSLALTPNLPGPNGVTVSAASSRRPAPDPIEAVALTLGGTSVFSLQPVEPGLYVGAVRIDHAGRLAVAVLVRRGAMQTSVPLQWTVGHAARRLAPELGLLVLLLIVIGLVATPWRWRRS
jgi:hypothetical protein